MNLNDVSDHLFENKELKARRKGWKGRYIALCGIGFMSRDYEPSDSKEDYFLALVEDGLYRNTYKPSLSDMSANDYEVF